MRNARLDVLEQARGRWQGILLGLGVDEKALSGKHGPCPVGGCGGKDRFRFDDKDGRGTYFCTQCGAGDGIKLVMLIRGVDFKAALKLVEEAMPSAPAVVKSRERTVEEKEKSLRTMWEKAMPLSADGVVVRYLASRGLTAQSPNLRESLLPYYEDGKRTSEYPAMVARISTVDGKGASLHITYLTADGRKASVSSPKKVMSPVRPIMGAAVQLQKAGEVLGVAEGIETALAAHERHGVPVWAALNAEGMAAFLWPPSVERLVIFADHDKNFAGHKAAYTLAFRASGKGLGVEVKMPQLVGMDWNDVVKEERERQAA